MKNRKCLKFFLVIMFSLVLAAPAQAGKIFTGVGVGTLGVGGDIGYQFNDFFKMRVNVNYLPFDYDTTYDSIDYDAELRNFTAGLLVDVHPFAGNFRITGGLYYRDLEVNLDASPHGGRNIGGYYFTKDEIGSLKAKVTWDKFTPYAGLGWGIGSGTGSTFHLDFNLGAMMLRGVDVDYELTGTARQLGSIYQEAIDREAQKIKDDIDDWKVYPVVSLFFSFRF